MKKNKSLGVIIILICSSFIPIMAQVPYFAGTVGKGKLYGYTSLKFRPGINSQETYTTFQYGVGKNIVGGLDLYTSNGSNYMGYLLRAGYVFNKWIGIGGQITPSFNMSDNYRFSYLTCALYLNGAVLDNERLFWCSNTWWGMNKGLENTISNWEYLGLVFPLKKGHSITPMVGAIHSWKFDRDVDLVVGCYYSIQNWNLYLWGNDFIQSHPRLVIGIDFSF